MNRTYFVIALLVSITLAACVSDVDEVQQEEALLSGQRSALVDDTPEAIGVLTWLNGPDATFEALDDLAALRSGAARNIVRHVRGADLALGTRDDNPIDSIKELDAIPQVGPASIDRLLEYVESIGGIPREIVEGHSLTDAQIIRMLEVVNHYSRDALDFHVNLDKRAANNLVARRPFGNMDEVAAVPFVGPATVARIRDYADLRQPGDEDIVVEGVVFTAPQAAEVVMLANLANFHELDTEVGLDARAVNHIIDARDIESVTELAGVKYVGRSALAKMREYLPRWTLEEEEEEIDPECADLDVHSSAPSQAAADLTQLLAIATTTDAPFAEVVTYESSTCLDIDDTQQQTRLASLLWQHLYPRFGQRDLQNTRVFQTGDFVRGGDQFLRSLNRSQRAIVEYTEDGHWDQLGHPDGQLYGQLDSLIHALGTEVAQNPDRFVEVELYFDAIECSERTIMLIDTETQTIVGVHEFSRC
jgi:DNA uptake protein ComE-like DNA-binding protein